MRTTKDRILDAAEKLFAEHGFAPTSLRAITAEAGANLASVNYYFQSKEALLQAVFARRVGPLNQQRLELLAEVEARAAGGPLPLEDVLRAIAVPIIRFGQEAPDSARYFSRLLGRLYSEPGGTFAQMIQRQFGEIKIRFTGALRRAVPGITETELAWKIYFLIGAIAHSTAGLHILPLVSDGRCDASDVDNLERHLIAFLAAGFRAPVPSPVPEVQHA